MKFFKMAVPAILAALMTAGTASATPAGLTGPIQTYSAPFGAAHVAAVTGYLNTYLGVSDVVYLGRYTGASNSSALEAVLNGTGAGFTITGGSTNSGTWVFNPGSTDYLVVGLEISTSGKADLYAVNPASNSGNWDTNDINGHNLSHLDFYARAIGTVKTPEPGTLLLLGGGIAAIGFSRRKKKA